MVWTVIPSAGERLGASCNCARRCREKNNVLQAGAASHRVGGHLRVIVQDEIVASDRAGSVSGGTSPCSLTTTGGIVGRGDPREHRCQIVDGVHDRPFIQPSRACGRECPAGGWDGQAGPVAGRSEVDRLVSATLSV